MVLSRDPYTVRMPLALFALFLIAVFAALYLLFNFIVGLFRTPKRIGKWRKGKQEIGAQQVTMRGFASLIEGDWNEAEGHLLSRLDHNNASLMNYLGAAYAAQAAGRTRPSQSASRSRTGGASEAGTGDQADPRANADAVRRMGERA